MNERERPKLCKHCGGRPDVVHMWSAEACFAGYQSECFWVECLSCGHKTVDCYTEEKAIEIWNSPEKAVGMNDNPTKKQLDFIERLHNTYMLPEFKGSTKLDASAYIDKYKSFVMDDWSIENGY